MVLNLHDFSYELPQELIAQEHAQPRSFSRLMVVKGKHLEHRRFYNIIDYLKSGDVLVLNTTKVLKNKLVGKKPTGATAEVILMDAVDDSTARCRIKGSSTIKVGNTLLFQQQKQNFEGKVIKKEKDVYFVRFSLPVYTIIDHAQLPNPPYIQRTVTENDYQTVFAQEKGSLAAPTAGLHFTKHLLHKLKKKGVNIATVTLHVGFGTFLPVKDPHIVNHKMEPEYYSLDEHNAAIINQAKRLFVVGTTSLKALESIATFHNCKHGQLKAAQGWSDLFIYPGYRFKLNYKGLITNFHLPRSTLILLVSAFYGWDTIKHAYETAVAMNYRFFSLGDAMLLLKV